MRLSVRAIAGSVLLLAFRAFAVTIDEYPVPASAGGFAGPVGITVGPDKNLWFAHFGREYVGRFAPSTPTAITQFPIPWTRPVDVVAGPDGNLWFTGYYEFGNISPGSGAVSEFSIPQYGNWPVPLPQGLTAGPDGDLWFVELFSVRRVSPATPGSVTTIPIPTGAHAASDIAAGPDGNLWFTASQIGRVTPGTSNTVTEFTIPSTPAGGSVEPWVITVGPDGNLWLTERTGNAIGRITPGSPNTITEFPLPTPGAGPAGITVGCDGGLWFTESDAGQIGRIDPQSPNTIDEYSLPTAFAGPTDIVTGPDENLWFTEYYADQIGRAKIKCLWYSPWRRIFVPNNFDEWWRLHGNPVAVAVLGNLLYLPAKAGFAAAGVAAGGLAYAATLGNLDAAMTIWRDAMRGDYVVTPDMVRRGTAPRFVGSDQRYVARRLPPAFLPPPGRSALPPEAVQRSRSAKRLLRHGSR